MNHPLLNIAIQAARNGGKIITRSLDRFDTVKVSEKGNNDFVTDIDKAVENEIMATISDAYPSHAFRNEESGVTGDDDYVWIVDPIDGTTNYIHGFPCFSISIAVKHKGVLQHGVIYDPVKGELFTASRGQGAYLNNRRMRVSQQLKLQSSLIGIGFPYRQPENLQKQLNTLKNIFPYVAGFRSIGSAALALAYVASGRLDGMWLACLSEWDIAAGILLVMEAGGLVSNYQGEEEFSSGNIVAGNSKILKSILKYIEQ